MALTEPQLLHESVKSHETAESQFVSQSFKI